MKKMIGLLMIVSCVLMFTGCKLGDVASNTALLTTIEVAGYNLGIYVGKSKTDADDLAIANAYKLAREGKLTPEEVAAAFAKLKIENPQLAGSLMIILKNMGAGFDAGGNLINLSGIPVEYWDAAASGYVLGYEFGKAGQKSIKPSAVKKYLPK